MKKIIFFVFVFLIIFLIYYFNTDEKKYYLSLGDYLSYGINNFEKTGVGYSDIVRKSYGEKLKTYVNYSTYDDYRVMDLINDINYNKTVVYNNKEYKLQNLLIKANLITVSIGMNDLLYKEDLDYNYVDELIKDIENLLIIIRKYNKDEVYFLGFYNIINNSQIIEYTNKKIESICNKNNIKYVDISYLENYIINGKYPTKEGYMYITDKIFNFTK